QGRSPWTRFSGVLSANPGPAFSTLAVIVIVLLLGVFVANRFLLDNGSSDDGNGQLAARPTLQSETPRSAVMLTTPEPTDEPEEPEPTANDEPAKQEEPEPTATEPPA